MATNPSKTSGSDAAESAADFPPRPAADPTWYPRLAPEARVAYRQAKLTYAQAYAAFDAGVAAAEEAAAKPENDFEAAKNAYLAADKTRTDMKAAAGEKLKAIGKLVAELEKTDDPLAAKQLQAAVDEYKAAVAAVATQQGVVDSAVAALRKLSDPTNPFDPNTAKANKAALSLANDQKELDVAKARIPLEAAYDTFTLKQAELHVHNCEAA